MADHVEHPPEDESFLKTKTFTYDDLKALRRESANHRMRAKVAEEKAADLQVKFDTAHGEAKAASDRATAAEKAADQRIIRSELRAAATKAGMVDLDGIALLDTASLKLTASGDVEGADELMRAAKETKPYLFGAAARTSSSTMQAPQAKALGASDVKNLSEKEFEAELARVLAVP